MEQAAMCKKRKEREKVKKKYKTKRNASRNGKWGVGAETLH